MTSTIKNLEAQKNELEKFVQNLERQLSQQNALNLQKDLIKVEDQLKSLSNEIKKLENKQKQVNSSDLNLNKILKNEPNNETFIEWKKNNQKELSEISNGINELKSREEKQRDIYKNLQQEINTKGVEDQISKLSNLSAELINVTKQLEELTEKHENLSQEYLELNPSIALKQEKAHNILQGLKDKGLISPNTQVKKIIKPRLSRFTSDILYLKDGGTDDSFVVKVFHSVDDFEKEKRDFEQVPKYANAVQELRLKCNCKLPIITKSRGGVILGQQYGFDKDTAVIVLEKAKGQTLGEYIDRIPQMSEDEIRNVWSKIGEQFGSLDYLMWQKDENILINEDNHSENFIYDEKKDDLYWIDTAGELGLKYIRNSDQLPLFLFLNNELRPGSKNLTTSLSYLKAGDLKQSPEDLRRLIDSYKKRLLARRSFVQAYYNKNNQPSIKEKYNGGSIERNIANRTILLINSKIAELSLPIEPLSIEKDFDIQ